MKGRWNELIINKVMAERMHDTTNEYKASQKVCVNSHHPGRYYYQGVQDTTNCLDSYCFPRPWLLVRFLLSPSKWVSGKVPITKHTSKERSPLPAINLPKNTFFSRQHITLLFKSPLGVEWIVPMGWTGRPPVMRWSLYYFHEGWMNEGESNKVCYE